MPPSPPHFRSSGRSHSPHPPSGAYSQRQPSLQRRHGALLTELGLNGSPDLVFVRLPGNIGHELSWAGARELLSGHPYREVGIDELPAAHGHTALIGGSGAWCGRHHQSMVDVLAVAELRFERVLVLPSSFDTSEEAVREALECTRALIFARERESHNDIQRLCQARLALDTSFFFEAQPYLRGGEGVMHAFRTDAEAVGARSLAPDNDDVSLTAGTLERWLQQISQHAVVRTDRVHVMIAAALLGKEVEFAADVRLSAIADYGLGELSVRRLRPSRAAAPRRAQLAPAACSPQAQALRRELTARGEAASRPAVRGDGNTGTARVTAVVISHDRPELLLRSLHSLVRVTDTPVDVVVVDNNSSPRTRRILADACAGQPRIRVCLNDRNLGAAGGRKRGLELVDSELVLFLDDDAELLPGALEHMISELDRHPTAGAVSATVVLPYGRVSHSGGSYEESEEIVSFTLLASGEPLDACDLPPSGPCDWVPWTALLVRAGIFEEFPLDPNMNTYYEDNNWSFRIARAKADCFRRSSEALVLHHASEKPWACKDFMGRSRMTRFISAAAYFYRLHGLLLGVPGTDIFAIMPELARTDGSLDLAGARLVMELASTHSPAWLLMEWMNGGLAPVLGVERTALGDELHRVQVEADQLRAELAAARADL